jgi:hypothetical protein
VTLRAAGPIVENLLAAEGYREPAQQMVMVDPKGTSEQSSPICNMPLLRQIADAAGGALMSPGAVPHALTHHLRPAEVEQAVLNRRPIWNQWWLLWLFFGCLTLEWMARRYWRMI